MEKQIKIIPANHEPEIDSIYNFLIDKKIERSYPKFKTWFKKIRRQKNNRKLYYALDDTKIVGVLILKKTKKEKKISTIFVKKEYRGLGIGKIFLREAYKYLETNNPKISVSESSFDQMNGFLRKNNFALTSIKFGKYVDFKSEYFYN